MDLEILEQGELFSELKSAFVIFFCRFDPFKRNLHRYTFRTFCEEISDLPLKDATYKVFLNTKAATKAADPELRALLDYIDGRGASSSFTQEYALPLQPDYGTRIHMHTCIQPAA